MPKLTPTAKGLRVARLVTIALTCLATQGCLATLGAKPDIAIRESMPTPNAMKSGWEYLNQNAYGAAIQAFRVALKDHPDDPSLNFGLAEAYRHAGYPEQAEALYAPLLENAEYRSAALTGIGHVKLMSHDADGAFEMFSTATAENETAWRAWLGLAQLRDLARDWTASDEAYQRALSSSNNRALVLNNHGVSMLARGEAKSALVYLEMAATISPNSERIRTNIDLAEASLTEGAITSKDKHLDGKLRARKLNNQGYAAMLRGDRAEAEKYFMEAIDSHPSFYAIAHKNLQTLKSTASRAQ